MILNRVVFPEPFGPMMPWMEFSATSKADIAQSGQTPKVHGDGIYSQHYDLAFLALDFFSCACCSTMDSLLALIGNRTDHAALQEENDQDHQDAESDLLVLHVSARVFIDYRDQRAAQHRAPGTAQAAQIRP